MTVSWRRSALSVRGSTDATTSSSSRRSNAHGTVNPEEREVLYPWHPWAKCLVRIHETIAKVDSIVLRCSRDGATERWLELPAWMFDRAIIRHDDFGASVFALPYGRGLW